MSSDRSVSAPRGNPFLDAMASGASGDAGGDPMAAMMSSLMGGGGSKGGMDIGALMGMMGGAGGGGGGGGAPAAGGMDMITKIMPYIPKILAFVSKVPSFLCGYCIGLAVLLLLHFIDPFGGGWGRMAAATLVDSNVPHAGVDDILVDSADVGVLAEDLFSGDLGVGGAVAASLPKALSGFASIAPQAGFIVVFLILVSLVIPVFHRARAIIFAAKIEVSRADDIAVEAKRKVAMKEHNAELD